MKECCSATQRGSATSCANPGRSLNGFRLPSIEPVVIMIVAIFVMIGLFAPNQWMASLQFTADSLVHIFPFLLLSAVLAAYLQAANADQLMSQILVGKEYRAIMVAALFGAISPFCSCGVIPLITALLIARVPLSAVFAFWIASPIMSPSMYVITAAGLGMQFATVKTFAAVFLGLSAGILTKVLQDSGYFKAYLKIDAGGDSKTCKQDLNTTKPINWRVWSEDARRKTLYKKTRDMIIFLGKWLTLAYVLESLMVRYVPASMFLEWLGDQSILAIPLSALIGVPAYLNGFAAVPVVASMIESGMSTGAALTFMLAGAMTSIPAALAVYSIVKSELFVWYITMALFGAMAMGWIYELAIG